MLENEDVRSPALGDRGKLLDRATRPRRRTRLDVQEQACRAAVKAGDETPPAEQEKFIDTSCLTGWYYPHGRPILIEMTRPELEKTFGRIQLKTGPSVRQTVRRKKK